MRIIHTADLHLDSPLGTNLSLLKQKERKRELLYNFERLINYAKEYSVNMIIISGDMFDRARIAIKTREYIFNLINENPTIDFALISGNHDEDSFVDEMEIIPHNLKVFDKDFSTIKYNNIAITGVNYCENYKYNNLNLKPDDINIVIMHGDINDEIDLKKLKNKNIDYLALGHIHKYSKGEIDDRGIYAYPGTLEGRGFDESGDKGFILLDIDSNINMKFIPFANRKLHDVNLNITGLENYQDIRRNAELKLNDIPQDDMVRLRLQGYYNLDLIKQNEMLEEALNEKFYFAKVSDESKLKINPKDYENDISLKGEFIRSVLNSDLPENDKNMVIEYGIKALLKEEI
ncbi:MAG: DNA repair exonuclease [Acholeplasmatales bacterium]|nr:DNA repair exonuclease [Acholeplasmatales bacterium]